MRMVHLLSRSAWSQIIVSNVVSVTKVSFLAWESYEIWFWRCAVKIINRRLNYCRFLITKADNEDKKYFFKNRHWNLATSGYICLYTYIKNLYITGYIEAIRLMPLVLSLNEKNEVRWAIQCTALYLAFRFFTRPLIIGRATLSYCSFLYYNPLFFPHLK